MKIHITEEATKVSCNLYKLITQTKRKTNMKNVDKQSLVTINKILIFIISFYLFYFLLNLAERNSKEDVDDDGNLLLLTTIIIMQKLILL